VRAMVNVNVFYSDLLLDRFALQPLHRLKLCGENLHQTDGSKHVRVCALKGLVF
jgi:hypothetical protein